MLHYMSKRTYGCVSMLYLIYGEQEELLGGLMFCFCFDCNGSLMLSDVTLYDISNRAFYFLFV